MSKKTRFVFLAEELEKFARREAGTKNTDLAEWLRQNENKAVKTMLENYPKTSPRTKLLVYAVTAKCGIEHANELLKKHDLEALYIRNINDMACMWALEKELGASDVCALAQELNGMAPDFAASAKDEDAITLRAVESYLTAAPSTPNVEAGKMTMQLEKNFNRSLLSGQTAADVMRENLSCFAGMRDRTRREFMTILREYIRSVIAAGDKEDTAGVLRVSQGGRLEDCKLNYANFASKINDLFGGALLDSDWVTEYAADPCEDLDFDVFEAMTPEEKKRWFDGQSLTAEEILDAKNLKKCVDILRGFLQGRLDITRTFFVVAVMYMNTCLDDECWLDLEALNKVLAACGWRMIQTVAPTGLDALIDYMFKKDRHVTGVNPHFASDDKFFELLVAAIDTLVNYSGFDRTHPIDLVLKLGVTDKGKKHEQSQ